MITYSHRDLVRMKLVRAFEDWLQLGIREPTPPGWRELWFLEEIDAALQALKKEITPTAPPAEIPLGPRVAYLPRRRA